MITRGIMTTDAVAHTAIYYGNMQKSGSYGLILEANELAASGARAGSIQARILYPAGMDRTRIHSMRKHIKRTRDELRCEGFGIERMEVAEEESRAVRVAAAHFLSVGFLSADAAAAADALAGCGAGKERPAGAAYAGQEIVFAGWAGMEGMLRIIGEREPELRERFTPLFLSRMKAYEDQLSGLRAVTVAREAGAALIRQVSGGGILAALMNLAEETGCGLEADLKKIAVLQETIEVCEHFRLNPYQLASGGSFLMLAERGDILAGAQAEKGIEAAVIGRLNGGNDKIIRNGGNVRYIGRPAMDELMKVL